MTEPVKTFSVGFAEAGSENELGGRPARSRVPRLGPPRARAVVRGEHGRSRGARLASRRAARGPLGARLSRSLRARLPPRDGRALRPGSRRALRRLLRDTRLLRSAGPWRRLPAPSGCSRERLAPVAPRRSGAQCRPSRPRARSTASCTMGDGNRSIPRTARPPLVGPLAAARRPGGAARSASSGSTASLTTRYQPRSTSTPSSGLVDDMLHYFDRTSMAHSLEVRVPFLDHELVELCARIPPISRCGVSARSTSSERQP